MSRQHAADGQLDQPYNDAFALASAQAPELTLEAFSASPTMSQTLQRNLTLDNTRELLGMMPTSTRVFHSLRDPCRPRSVLASGSWDRERTRLKGRTL